jgi:16S rRNA (uracil1498-N3)-methyltransferase
LTSNRFCVDKADVRLPLAVLKGKEHHHLARVVRIRPGDIVWLSDQEGTSYRARVERIGDDETRLYVLEHESGIAQKHRLVLAQSVLKQKAMEWGLQKATELGVAAVEPILTARTVVKLAERWENKHERWIRILREAAKQCGRPLPPELIEPVSLNSWLEQPRDALKLVLDESGGTRLKDVVLASFSDSTNRGGLPEEIIILVGPEGGWTNDEQKAILEHGFEAVDLGDNSLRAETAAITSLAIISHFWNT